MEQNNTAKEITFGDLCRIFAKKWVLFLVVAIVVGAVGGVYGLIDAFDNRTYTATLTFNISDCQNPDDLLYLLRSERFAEALLLEENGLPENNDAIDDADYAAAEAALKSVAAIREEKKSAQNQLDRLQVEFNSVTLKEKQLETDYNEIAQILTSLRPQTDAVVDEATRLLITAYNQKLTEQKAKIDTFRTETYRPLSEEIDRLTNEILILDLDLRDAQEVADEATEKVMSVWRANTGVTYNVNTIMNGVTYTFESPIEKNATADAAHKGYIKVSMTFDNETFANSMLECFKEKLPAFVEDYIEDTSEVVTVANCKLISTFAEVESPSVTYYVTETVKMAAIAAVAVDALIYIILVLRLLVRTESENKKAKEE